MTLSISDSFVVLFVTKCFEKQVAQKVMADLLGQLGYTSKDGKPLTNSHMSNFERKDLNLRRTNAYTKPNYPTNHVDMTRIKVKGLFHLKKKMEDGQLLTDEDRKAIAKADEADFFLKISEHYRLDTIEGLD